VTQGGVLEYTSLVFGYRWLLILVAALYSLEPPSWRASAPPRGCYLASRTRHVLTWTWAPPADRRHW